MESLREKVDQAVSGERPEIQVRIAPFHFVLVLDTNKNVSRVVSGPRTFTCLDHERFISGIEKMIAVPPRQYCVVENPVMRRPIEGQRDDVVVGGDILFDAHGQARLRHGDREVRLEQEPFPLFPGEKLVLEVRPLDVVTENSALRLRAIRDFLDTYGECQRTGGEEWLVVGPCTYVPQAQVEVVEKVHASIILPNEALVLRARKDCTDVDGVEHKAGERWLIRTPGTYLPRVDEIVVKKVTAHVLNERRALGLEAICTFTDVYGVQRKAGDTWLVTLADAETHIPDVGRENVLELVPLTTVAANEYCVILNPYDEETKKCRLGHKSLVVGPRNFFLQPGESLRGGAVREILVLGEEEAVHVMAVEDFVDEAGSRPVKRKSGKRWFVYGPCSYIPPVEVRVLGRQRAVIYLESLNFALFFSARTILFVLLVLVALFYLLRLSLRII